jgi:hypothetical protein
LTFMANKLPLLMSVLFFAVIIVVPFTAKADRTLYTVATPAGGGPSPNLRIVNPLNGATIETISISLPGFTVQGATGLPEILQPENCGRC